MNKAEILKDADRFSELSKCKREPVSKFPLDIDSISGLVWRDGDDKVPECVNFYMINLFFVFSHVPDSLPETLGSTLDTFVSENPEAKKLIEISECFSEDSLDKFTATLAKQLVKIVKGRDVQTKDIKKALTVFGLIGRDAAFATLFKGKAYAVKHRRGLKPVFGWALQLKNTPYTALLFQILNYTGPSVTTLKGLNDVRKIFNDESLLSNKNSFKKKKLKDYQLPAAVRKHTEKLIATLYQDIIEDYLFLPRYQTYAEWKTIFVDDLSGLRVARSLVWGFYENDELLHTFTVNLNGKLVDSHNQPIENIDFNKIQISPAHPIEMKDEEKSLWQDYFSETGISQLVEQLSLAPIGKKGNPLNNYLDNPKILPDGFWKRKMNWWYSEEESGVINAFNRDFEIKKGNLRISIQTYIDRRGSFVEELPSLKNIQLLDSDGKTLLDRFTLAALPDRTYSELCRELDRYFLRK